MAAKADAFSAMCVTAVGSALHLWSMYVVVLPAVAVDDGAWTCGRTDRRSAAFSSNNHGMMKMTVLMVAFVGVLFNVVTFSLRVL